MPSLSEKDRANLEAGLDAIRKIEAFVQEVENADQFFEEEMIFDATLMNFVVLGEVVSKISEETQLQYSEVPWGQIKGFRNLIAHHYFGVDAEEVWQIIHNHLPAFQSDIQQILEEAS